MSFLDTLRAYFDGERLEAFFFILPAGLIMLILAGTALKAEGGAYGIAMAVPLIVFGLVLAATGLGVGLRTRAQVEQLEKDYAASPKAMVEKELPRMEKVNANWPKYLAVWTALVVAGLVFRFAFKADWAHGLGPGLLLAGAIGFLVDGFAERRSRPYTAALVELAAKEQ